MTLVATVLLSAIAATIALVLVRQTVLIVRSETDRGNVDAAHQAALAVKLQFERELAADPGFIFERLFAYERPRICGNKAIIPPEEPATIDDTDPAAPHNTPWPADCPRTWTYLDTGMSAVDADGSGRYYTPAEHPVRVEISPPTSTRPTMTVTFLAARGRTETGVRATYRTASAAAVTAYAAGDLRLDTLTGAPAAPDSVPSPALAVSGSVYAGGRMYLPTTEADLSGAQLFAEGGFVGTLPTHGRFFTAAPTGAGGPDPDDPGDIRGVVAHPLRLADLRGSYGRLETVGCPDVAAAQVTVDGVPFSSQLCLRHQSRLVDTGNSPVVVSTTGSSLGDRPAAYLLMFTGTPEAPMVKVFTAASAPSTVGACVLRCDLTALAGADFAAGRHPASPPAVVRSTGDPATAPLWQPLGEFFFPASGVIVTDATTYVGQCPEAIAGGDTCTGGTEAASSVTVVAGSPHDPRDVVLAGPVTGAPAVTAQPATVSTPAVAESRAASVGLVATRAVVVPHFARPAGGDLEVAANLVAYGYGLAADEPALVAYPALVAPREVNPGNYGRRFTVTGSVAAPTLTATLAGWEHVRVRASAAPAAPPYFPGFTAAWVAAGTERLSSYDVCGLASCVKVW